MTRSLAWATLIIGTLLTACTGERGIAPSSQAAEGVGVLPKLMLEKTLDGMDTLGLSSIFALGPQGDLVFETLREPTVLFMVPVDGSRGSGFAARGEGPGEMLDAMPYAVTESEVVTMDASSRRLSIWSHDGELRRSRQIRSADFIELIPIGDGRYLMDRVNGDGFSVATFNDRTGAVDPLVPSSDSFVATNAPTVGEALKNRLAIGRWHGGVIVANRLTYQLALYDWEGRQRGLIGGPGKLRYPDPEELDRWMTAWIAAGRPGRQPDDRRRAEMASTPMPWFSSRVRQDDHGRIWLMRSVGDSARIDIYHGEQFVGHVLLPCSMMPDRWDLNGTWMAVACVPPSAGEANGPIVKLYRVYYPDISDTLSH